MTNTEKLVKSQEIGELFEWDKWNDEIPFIDFKRHWKVQPIAPFRGAVVRFMVKDKYTGKTISVFLDCYNVLGVNYSGEDMSEPEPYWEMHPYGQDVRRFNMDEEEKLVECIEEEFNEERSKWQKIKARFLG